MEIKIDNINFFMNNKKKLYRMWLLSNKNGVMLKDMVSQWFKKKKTFMITFIISI